MLCFSCKMCKDSDAMLLVVALAVFVKICASKVELNGGQRIILPANVEPSIADSITSGTLLAFENCQYVFRWDRWNCPRGEFYGQLRQSTNKETALTQAIIAAGIVHSVTKNCSRGEIRDCACDPKFKPTFSQPKSYQGVFLSANDTIRSNILLSRNTSDNIIKWSWGGCSDDTSFGIRLVEELLEDSEKNLTVLSYIRRHNYRLGKQLILQSMIKKCRCHGVSGSCSLQTCWMQQAPFQIIAGKLKEKHKKAKRLTSETIRASIAIRNSIKREDKEKIFPAPENMLVYLEQSPDYCVSNVTENWPGTKGRLCSRKKSALITSSERKSCRTLCRQCGYKVRKEKIVVKNRCNCTFQWCCSVQCDLCTEVVEEFYCY